VIAMNRTDAMADAAAPSLAVPSRAALLAPTVATAAGAAPDEGSRRWLSGRRLAPIAWLLACSVIAAAFLFPIAWSLLTSLKPPAEASASPPTWLPTRISLDNYVALARSGTGIGRYIANSLAVSAMTVAGTLVLSLFAGYGFSRFRFPGSRALFVVVLATMMIPFQSILTPLFVLLRTLGLQDTLFGLSLVYITFQLPFSVFMMKNSFDSVPRELDEAAMLDGCSAFGVLRRVLLRVVAPGLVTVALFAFFAAWNELLVALVLISDASKMTLPVFLQSAQSQFLGGIDWGLMQAGIGVSILPCALLFLALQRFYINGLIAGAVKA
jgi:multiple sugar transport system permease protein